MERIGKNCQHRKDCTREWNKSKVFRCCEGIMDIVDIAQGYEIQMYPAEFQDRCKVCLVPMASHLLEEGLCIDCDMEVIQ